MGPTATFIPLLFQTALSSWLCSILIPLGDPDLDTFFALFVLVHLLLQEDIALFTVHTQESTFPSSPEVHTCAL